MSTAANTDEIVLATFHLDGIHFALDTTQVREAIILEKEIMPLPSSVDFVEGVMDLRGTIVPLINLKKRLRRPDTGYRDDTRAAIVALKGVTLGILFDGVKDVIRVRRDEIVQLIDAFQGSDTVISGLVNHTVSGRIIEIIEPGLLVSEEQRDGFAAELDTQDRDADAAVESGRTLQLVVFACCGQEYGVELAYVKEVETVRDVDTAFRGQRICGAVPIHGHLVPLIRLDSFGNGRGPQTTKDTSPLSASGNVVVLIVDDAIFAITIDQVKEMLTVRESQLSAITFGKGDDHICYAQLPGERSIQIIDAPSAFRHHIKDIQSLNSLYRRESLPDMVHPTQAAASKTEDTVSRYLVFEAGQPFALDISCIQEILPNVDIIAPLFAHDHLEGVLNLRQETLPVFDLKACLGLVGSEDQNGDTQRIIVIKEDEKVVVLRVDRVLKLAASIRETPLPPLGEKLSRMRALFKSMLVSKDETGMVHHVLRFDSNALIERLMTLETGSIEREEDV